MPVTPTNRAVALLAHALLLALVLGILAYWAPWVNHAAAALKLSGQDLGEFVKFIPAIRRGDMPFPRQLFYLPPLVMAVVLVLLSVNQELPYPGWLRIVVLASSVALLLGLLPPAWGHPRELFSSEFRLQGIGILLGASIAAAHGLFRRLPLRSLAGLLLGLAPIALVAPQGAFWAIRPKIWAAYDTPGLRLGCGLWLHAAAWLGATACAGALLIRAQRKQRRPDAVL